MKIVHSYLLFLVFLFINIHVLDSKQLNRQEKQNILLHEAVKKLLGFSDSSGKSASPRDAKRNKEAPRYMLDLYEQYSARKREKFPIPGNTVRSFNAEIGKVNGEIMFIFNLSSMISSERLMSAEVHFYKKKNRPWRKNKDVDIILREVAPEYLSDFGKIKMREKSFGWQSYDVTGVVNSCLDTSRRHPHLFAMNFEADRANGKTHSIALTKFTRHHSLPYLIIYANDTERIQLGELGGIAEKLINNEKESKVKAETNNMSAPSNQTTENTAANDIDNNQTEVTSYSNRIKRSILSNEIPEDPVEYDKQHLNFNIPQTHPGILHARNSPRHRFSDTMYLPYPDRGARKKGNRRQHRRHRNKNRRNRRKHIRRRLPFPNDWDEMYENEATDKNTDTKLCGRRKLMVNFADIGWGDWIISPKSFDAHYCAGSCPFPLTEGLRPSNHATIQSIVHAIGLYSGVPAPCCVPEAMSSVTILYFNENSNVVLKNYPSMTVLSCSCR